LLTPEENENYQEQGEDHEEEYERDYHEDAGDRSVRLLLLLVLLLLFFILVLIWSWNFLRALFQRAKGRSRFRFGYCTRATWVRYCTIALTANWV
jgi:hypothetical protein